MWGAIEDKRVFTCYVKRYDKWKSFLMLSFGVLGCLFFLFLFFLEKKLRKWPDQTPTYICTYRDVERYSAPLVFTSLTVYLWICHTLSIFLFFTIPLKNFVIPSASSCLFIFSTTRYYLVGQQSSVQQIFAFPNII